MVVSIHSKVVLSLGAGRVLDMVYRGWGGGNIAVPHETLTNPVTIYTVQQNNFTDSAYTIGGDRRNRVRGFHLKQFRGKTKSSWRK